ncbi:RNA-guided endonuclease InsQ/TnpB family protein [Frankia gtarii]|uniref:RNA-guided endonuclease InsQ/TnpB family protein n=1 Tax=Frankia gtarii TaxID=2950102 RepID=UPI0021BFF320|nr:transposase [Frankia gtarii]
MRTRSCCARPPDRPTVAFGEMLDDHRELYNAALQERRDAYRHPSQTRVRYGDQSAQVKGIRGCDPDQARWSFSSQQATLRGLEKAFAGFFRRVKAGGIPQHRRVLGRGKTVSVKRAGRRWYVILSCDDVPAEPLPPAGAVVGVDVGIASFPTTSAGEHEPNPTCLARSAARLGAAQRGLSRAKRGSARRRKVATRVGTISRRVARQRLDHAHKTALGLVRGHDLIAVEKLTIKGMTRRARPRPDPDRPGVFLVDVDARHTSQRCAACGHVAEENRRRRATFACVQCGHTADADENAAVNILRAGLARQADAQAA